MLTLTFCRNSAVHLKVLSIYSSDAPDPETWNSVPRDRLFHPLIVEIGFDEQTLGDFQLTVATEAGLIRWHRLYSKIAPTIDSRHVMIVEDTSWPNVMREISDRVAACDSRTKAAALKNLRIGFHWEYEDCEWVRSD